MSEQKILGRCSKCGRGYIMLPGDGQMVDRYAPPDMHHSLFPTDEICGGEIVLTDEGHAKMTASVGVPDFALPGVLGIAPTHEKARYSR